MSDLRFSARVYILLLTLASLALAVLLRLAGEWPSTQRLWLAVAFLPLMVMVLLFPLHFAFKAKLTLDTAVIFAAILLFHPVIAMIIAGAGMSVSGLLTRRSVYETLFNGAQVSLQTGVAGLILSQAGWNVHVLRFDEPGMILAILCAAAAMYLVNQALVAVMIALHTGHSLLLVWRQWAGFDLVEQLSQLALGLLAAAVVDNHPWALPILLLPGFAIYRSTQRHVQLRQQTVDAVQSLADVVDIRDPYTANHSQRVAELSRALALHIGLAPDEVNLIERAARVHDVGKVVVDTVILTKQGKLTEDEWQQLKQHPVTGAKILSRFPQFSFATRYVRHHHERMDGRGYPDGLRGDQIPLGSRIIAVADSFDAMTTARPYRNALPLDTVLTEMHRQRGKQWDPQVVDVLLRLVEAEQVVPGLAPNRIVSSPHRAPA